MPKLYEDAPQWMKDLVQLVVNSAMDTGNASTLAQLASMLSQFATSYVPLNQYTQSILDLSNADANIHTVIETLNSNYNNGLSQANAQIISLQNTKASKDEVVTQVVNTLASQLANPTSSLGAAIGNLQQTIVNNQNANALSMQTLTSSLNDVSGNVSANSSAITGLQTNVSNINGTLTSQAGQITNLRSDLTSGTGTWAAGDTSVTSTVKSYTDGKVTGVESKWAYNSSLTINGTSYNSGFGLSNSAGTGAGSEFWIDASRLKFTNAAKTGSKAPFTIDASGSTPQVQFNGIVSFSNVTGYTPPDVSGSIATNNDVFAQKLGYANYQAMVNAAASGQTVINGGYINTGLIQAGAITADKIDANAISGKTISGGIITGTKLYGTQIEGAIIKASYIDLSSTATLTNWQQYTPANYPSAYDANFAKKNDGTLLVDSQGYVRLMGNTNILTQNYYYTLNYNGRTSPAINRTDTYTVNLYSWNNYTVSTLNRMITDSHRVQLSSPSGNWSSVSADFTSSGMQYNEKNVLIQAEIIGDTAGEVSTAYVKFNLLGDIFECYTRMYTGSSSNINWYMKKNSVTLYSGNTNGSDGLYTNNKNGLEYAIYVGASGYTGSFPMIKVKFKSNDFTLSGLAYSVPFFVLIESTAVGNAYAYVIDIPNIKVI